jgi:hypothetical protein
MAPAAAGQEGTDERALQAVDGEDEQAGAAKAEDHGAQPAREELQGEVVELAGKGGDLVDVLEQIGGAQVEEEDGQGAQDQPALDAEAGLSRCAGNPGRPGPGGIGTVPQVRHLCYAICIAHR